MRPFWALIRKQIVESRYTLLFSAAALFCLGWLFVYGTSFNEAEILHQLDSGEGGGRIQFLRYLGVAKQPESIELLLVSWNHPLIVLLISFWPISRGSAAVAAEVERGTMDLILSRPVARWAYLAAQVFVAILGLAILPGALLAGTLFGVRYNILHDPPGASALIRPALNLAALGLPMYGYTLLVSALDHVRWRPTSIGSGLTLGGYIAFFVSVIPALEGTWWKPLLERISIFKAYNPVELVANPELFSSRVELLAGIGAGAIILAFVAFAFRDLPTNG